MEVKEKVGGGGGREEKEEGRRGRKRNGSEKQEKQEGRNPISNHTGIMSKETFLPPYLSSYKPHVTILHVPTRVTNMTFIQGPFICTQKGQHKTAV